MKSVAVMTAFLLVSFYSWSQFRLSKPQRQSSSSSSSLWDKIYLSGGGGFGAGTSPSGRYNYFSLLPTVGYKVEQEFLLGVNIMYSKYSYPDLQPPVSYDQFGVGPFARYYIQQLFFQVEYDKISSTTVDNQPRRYYDRLLFGLGYYQPLGKRGSINAMVMYDVLYKTNGVFASPFVTRVFFAF